MKRFLSPFVVVLTAIVALAYAYVAWRLAWSTPMRMALALPFFLVWIVPLVYWSGERESATVADELLHAASYLCMGWLNFLLILVLARDALLMAARALGLSALHAWLHAAGPRVVLLASLLCLAGGLVFAFRGPHLRRVKIPIQGLHPGLEGLRIVQISDLHVGPTIGERYVRRVVAMSNALAPHLTVLTGDIVDGPPSRLARHVAPLAELSGEHGVVFVLGNHDCYSGAQRWCAHFQSLGMQVLLNSYITIARGGAKLVLGGVVDPAIRLSHPDQRPRADLAAGTDEGAALRILLAHNPALAPMALKAGFDLQLSGHTHAGQFFPWTLAVRLVHSPHVCGLSRLNGMWVYVSAGTGSWGPPVRFGSEPELTVLELVRPAGANQ